MWNLRSRSAALRAGSSASLRMTIPGPVQGGIFCFTIGEIRIYYTCRVINSRGGKYNIVVKGLNRVKECILELESVRLYEEFFGSFAAVKAG